MLPSCGPAACGLPAAAADELLHLQLLLLAW